MRSGSTLPSSANEYSISDKIPAIPLFVHIARLTPIEDYAIQPTICAGEDSFEIRKT
jgi:hypothetical protein